MTINVYLGSGDTFTAANNNEIIHGGPGNQTVLIGSGVTGTTFDANVERVALAGNLASYTFQTVAGVGLQLMSGTTVIATLPSLNQATTVAFADGSAPLVQTGGAAYTLGGQAISTSAVNLTTAQLGSNFNTTDQSGLGTGGTGGVTGPQPATTVSAAGTNTEVAAATYTYNLAAPSGTYTYNIAGFHAGDKIVGFSGGVWNVSADANLTDGIKDMSENDTSGHTITIHLTGLTSTQDAGVFNTSSFNTVFGAGSLA